MLEGGCFCGLPATADAAPFQETNCHRSICRRTSGAPYGVVSVPAALRFWRVPASLTSEHAPRPCSRCGTSHLPVEPLSEIDVTTCSSTSPTVPSGPPMSPKPACGSSASLPAFAEARGPQSRERSPMMGDCEDPGRLFGIVLLAAIYSG
jgi:hypothetical protein